MDGIKGIIKNKVFCDLNSGTVHIKDAKPFAEYADLAIDNIKSLYLSVNDVLEEPIDSASKITPILEDHQVKKEFNVDGLCKLQFFKVASDSLLFHEKFYQKYGDPEVCDHPLLSFSFNPENTCAACKDSYLGTEDWLESKIYE